MADIYETWVQPVRAQIAMQRPGVFRFLNETRNLGWPIDWRAADASLLWRYNLHYFDDLNSWQRDDRTPLHRQVIEQWVDAHPPGTRPAWEPYPSSLRIVNWIKWSAAGGQLSPTATVSLAGQVRWLAARPEWHLLGNHLFANAKALVFAGCFFSGPEADGWARAGLRIIEAELDEQILPDGGNFELSPMYHSILLADLLDLLNLSRSYPHRLSEALKKKLAERAARMFDWLGVMAHPDGDISMFNDAAIGVAPSLAELRSYAQHLSIPEVAGVPALPADACVIRLLKDSGYARLACADAVALCDVARIGPDYLPGHAHADTLSFELSVGGHRVIVNGGTSRYGTDDIRLCERGTASHSTVTVDESDSSEVWSGFRVARRARPLDVSCDVQPGLVSLLGSHDGYKRLHRKIVHRRQWTMAPASLRVEDTVSGPWTTATARYILHASIRTERLSANAWLLTTDEPAARSIHLTVEGGSASLEPAVHTLEFGRRTQTHAVAVELVPGGRTAVTIAWA